MTDECPQCGESGVRIALRNLPETGPLKIAGVRYHCGDEYLYYHPDDTHSATNDTQLYA